MAITKRHARKIVVKYLEQRTITWREKKNLSKYTKYVDRIMELMVAPLKNSRLEYKSIFAKFFMEDVDWYPTNNYSPTVITNSLKEELKLDKLKEQ